MSLGCGLKTCISRRFLGGRDAAGPEGHASKLTKTWKLIRSQCSWPEESRTALLVYRSPPSSRCARGVYRLSSMVMLYLMPRGGRGHDEGGATFPPKTVCLSFKIASGKSASFRKPSSVAREEQLLSPHEAQYGWKVLCRYSQKGERKELKRREGQKEET